MLSVLPTSSCPPPKAAHPAARVPDLKHLASKKKTEPHPATSLPPSSTQWAAVQGQRGDSTAEHHPSPTALLITLMNLHGGCQFHCCGLVGTAPSRRYTVQLTRIHHPYSSLPLC